MFRSYPWGGGEATLNVDASVDCFDAYNDRGGRENDGKLRGVPLGKVLRVDGIQHNGSHRCSFEMDCINSRNNIAVL